MDPFLSGAFVYFAAKYVLAVAMIWMTVHLWATGKFGGTQKNYDPRPWLAKHPVAMLALFGAAAGFILVGVMNNLAGPAKEMYYNALVVGAPVLHSLFGGIVIVLACIGAIAMYRRREHTFGGVLSFIGVMTLELVVPYYTVLL